MRGCKRATGKKESVKDDENGDESVFLRWRRELRTKGIRRATLGFIAAHASRRSRPKIGAAEGILSVRAWLYPIT